MEDDLDAQLKQQMAKLWRLQVEKVQREWEVREKVEHEVKEKAEREAREKAEREAREKERQDVEFWVEYAEEQWWKHKAAAQQVAEAKQLQRQVQMLEASRSGRNGESDVSSPSPSPMYVKLI